MSNSDKQSGGVEAPITVSSLSHDALEDFLESINTTSISSSNDREEHSIKNIGELSITYKDARGREELEVQVQPELGSGIGLSVTAPLSKWAVTQSVDDHNLLTRLIHTDPDSDQEAEFYIYGPPAKLEAFDIVVNGSRNHETLISDEYRDEN